MNYKHVPLHCHDPDRSRQKVSHPARLAWQPVLILKSNARVDDNHLLGITEGIRSEQIKTDASLHDNNAGDTPAATTHCDIWKYYHTTIKAHVKILHNLTV